MGNELQNVKMFSAGIGFGEKEKYNKLSLVDVYDYITDGENKQIFDAIRNADEEVQNELKKKLPWVTLSGCFEGSRRKEKFNAENVEFVQADFDHIENPLELKHKLSKLECVKMCFISPSGKGVKAIIHVEKVCKDFLTIWKNVHGYLMEETGCEIDVATKDISRLMFLSYDENCYINYNSIPLQITETENIEVRDNIPIKEEKQTNMFKTDSNNDFAKVRGALNYVDCEDYQVWLKVGMALHNSFFASEYAKQLWSDWSSRSAKFNQNNIDYKWNSFDTYTGKKVTIATIFKIAMDNGWKVPKTENKQILSVDDCNEREQNGIQNIKNEWYFCSKTNSIINKNTFEELNGIGRDSLIKSACGAKIFNVAIQQLERIYDTVHWWGYDGVIDFENKKLFSKWTPFVPQNIGETYNPGDALKILKTFLNINYDESELLLQWIACCVHGKLTKPDWGLALYGEKGSGKGILFEIISALIGVQNTSMRTPKQVDGIFNGDFEGKRLVFFDEMVAGKKELLDFQNDMKDKITAKFLKVRAMRKDQYVVPSHIMFMMATNHGDGFPIEENDGRWLVLKSKIKVKNRNIVNQDEKNIVDRMWNILQNNAKHLFEELKAVDFSGLPRNAPETVYHREIVESKSSYTEEVVDEYVNEFLPDIIRNSCNDDGFIKASSFKDWCLQNGRKINNNDLRKSFFRFGYEIKKKRIDGKEYRGYQKI